MRDHMREINWGKKMKSIEKERKKEKRDSEREREHRKRG